MSFAASVADIKAEIADIQQLLLTRPVQGVHDRSPTERSLVQGLVQKIAFLVSFSTQDAAEVSETVRTSNLHQASKQDLVQAVDDRLLTGSSMASVSAKPQYLSDINNYLTEAEWTSLASSDVSYQSKVQIVIERLISLHVHSLHEQTVKHCIALLLAVQFKGQGWPSYSSIHNMVVDFKKSFAASEKKGVARLIHYPSSADKLPEALYSEAYPDASNPPVHKEVERMKVIANSHVPLRSTSALLKKDNIHTSPPVAAQPFTSASAAAAPAAMLDATQPGLNAVFSLLAQVLSHAVGTPSLTHVGQASCVTYQPCQATAAAPSPAVTPGKALAIKDSDRLTPPKPTLAAAAASDLPLRSSIPVEKASEEDRDGSSMDEVEDGDKAAKSSKEFEDSLYNSLKKKSSKRAKKEKVMKRPAAAVSSSSASSKGVCYAVTAAGADSMTKHAFTSKHYHGAHKLAKKLGKDDYAAKLAARAAYTEAAKVWAQQN